MRYLSKCNKTTLSQISELCRTSNLILMSNELCSKSEIIAPFKNEFKRRLTEVMKRDTSHSNLGLLVAKDHMSPVLRKPVFRVSDQVRHKPACTVSEVD